MGSETLQSYQSDMRTAYACGWPGAFVSGMIWIAAAVALLAISTKSGVWVLLLGGVTIFPLSLVVCRVSGASGKHTVGNPLGLLAIESTLWLMAGIFISFSTILAGTTLFFPTMLLVIGSRYLTFQSIYGLKHYWIAGCALCIAGFAATLASLTAWIPAAMGGVIELALASALFMRNRRGQ